MSISVVHLELSFELLLIYFALYSKLTQLEKENELAMIDLQIGEMNAYIAAVETRKAELNA